MKILILKNGDVSAELDRLSAGNEPSYSYISEIFTLRSFGSLYVLGHSKQPNVSSYQGVKATTIARQRSALSEIKAELQIWKHLSKIQPDVVIVLHAYELLVVPYLWSRITKTPFLPCIAGQPEPENVRLLRRLLIKLVIRPLLRTCPRILARAELIKADLVNWRIPEERISVYLPPYTNEFFECKHLLPIRQDRFNIVFIGRLVMLKGVFDVIEIVKKVIEKEPAIHLFIVGFGPERVAMEQMVHDFGMKGMTTFVGEVPQAEVYGYLAPADVALLPSHSEGLGKTALEALLSGLPVLATQGTGLTEFVRHDYNGYLLPKGDIDGFERALTGLVADSSRLALLKKNARATRDTIMGNSETFGSIVADFVSTIDRHEGGVGT